VQFLPAVVVPQILLCGLFVPRDDLPDVLSAWSDLMPLSYAVEAMQHLTRSTSTGEVWADLGIVAAFAVAAVGLGAATLQRRTP
jgi:ABC-2 type transport system permease protein